MTEGTDVATTMAEAARLLQTPHTLEETFDTIVTTARDTVPGAHHVALCVREDRDRLALVAATDQTAWVLESATHEAAQGPCLDVLLTCRAVSSPQLAGEKRWPETASRAGREDVGAQLSLPLTAGDRVVGGLGLFSTRGASAEPQAELASVFAVHAGVALERARAEDQLHEALTTRKLVGQAVGLLMERYQVDDGRAFQLLVRVAETGGLKIQDVAREVVDQANGRAMRRT